MSLRNLTEDYIHNFNKKDITAIGQMLHPTECCLSDPENIFLGAKNVEMEIKNLFEFSTLVLEAKNLYVCEENDTSFIEFKIQLNDNILDGVDIIEWKDNKITALRAYVNPSIDKRVHDEF